MRPLRTLLIDDNRAFVVLARHLLTTLPQLQVVGEGYDGHDAVRLAEEVRPDLVVMDLVMPGMSGLQATRLIKAQDQPPRVIIASHYDDAVHRESAAQSGADGFINKQDYEHRLSELLLQLFNGDTHV